MAKTVDDRILAILSRVTVVGDAIFLTCGQLDRKEYTAINEVLENMGGKWNKKTKSHIFAGDPTDSLEQVLLSGQITQPEKYGYFPTPPSLAAHVVSLAHVESKHRVLEPSAGQGGLANLLRGSAVDCVELLPENLKVLKAGGHTILHEGCFLSLIPSADYDRVVMNPPFEKQADIDHVMHAWEFVKPGGRLVSIMASSVAFRENKKTVEFRDHLDRFGRMEHNPAGSFKESGTMVNTVTVVMDKPTMEAA